jgi:hypothetical protein
MEVTGIVKSVGNIESFGSNGFQKRDLIVTIPDDKYPQHINLEFQQDKCDLLNNLKIGQEITVNVNLRGKEWVSPQGVTKYFNTIVGWRIESVPFSEASKQQPTEVLPKEAFDAPQENLEELDDLPF